MRRELVVAFHAAGGFRSEIVDIHNHCLRSVWSDAAGRQEASPRAIISG